MFLTFSLHFENLYSHIFLFHPYSEALSLLPLVLNLLYPGSKMRVLPILALIPFFGSVVCANKILSSSEIYYLDTTKFPLEPMSPNFSRLYDLIMEQYDPAGEEFDSSFDELDIFKRDALESTLQQLIESLNRSGVIMDILHEIADSPEQMNTLSNWIFQFLVRVKASTTLNSLDVLINITELKSAVMESGLIQSTFLGMLLDETQRNLLADNLGEVLVNYSWIGEVLKNVGQSGQISFNMIFNIVRDYKSKDPGFNGTSYLKLRKRGNNTDYSGSLQAFLNNIAGSALSSQLASSSLGSILSAVNNSGVVISTLQASLGDQKILTMVGFIANKIYNFGVFDAIPLNDYFQKGKANKFLSKQLEAVLVNPTWSPPLGMVLQRMENQGVFEQLRLNLYGS